MKAGVSGGPPGKGLKLLDWGFAKTLWLPAAMPELERTAAH